PLCVLAGESPCCAADLRRRPSERSRKRSYEPDGKERDAEEHEQGSAEHEEKDAGRSEAGRKQAPEHSAETERRQQSGCRESKAGVARFRQCGAFSDGGDRGHPRSTQRGAQACEE